MVKIVDGEIIREGGSGLSLIIQAVRASRTASLMWPLCALLQMTRGIRLYSILKVPCRLGLGLNRAGRTAFFMVRRLLGRQVSVQGSVLTGDSFLC